jgi:uncharacterized metal-binding protein
VATGRQHFDIWVSTTRIVILGAIPVFLTLPVIQKQVMPDRVLIRSVDYFPFVWGWLIAVLMHPDLDQGCGSWIDRVLRGYCPPLGLVWATLWFPYAAAIPHRSRWSHGFVVGTLLRILYWTGMVLFVALLLGLLGEALVRMNAWGYQRGLAEYWLVGKPNLNLHTVWQWIQHTRDFVARNALSFVWLYLGQELSTIVTHLLPDKLSFYRPAAHVDTRLHPSE